MPDGPGELPTLPAPHGRYVRVTALNPGETVPLKLTLSVEIAAGGTVFTGNATVVRGPGPELDLKAAMPLERVSLTLPCDEHSCPALRLDLLEGNREVTASEVIPTFIGRTVVPLRRPPEWRPIVWDAGVVPLLNHERTEWRSAPHGIAASSPGGLAWDGSAVAVDLLMLRFPQPMSVVPVAVWAVISLPTVPTMEACSLMTFVGSTPAKGMIGLGYSREGRLLHLLGSRGVLPPPAEEDERRVWVTPTAEGVGPSVPFNQPIVLAVRYTAHGNGVGVTFVHPNGSMWRVDHPNVQPPEVDTGLIWGNPEAPMRGEPDVHRRLRVHEVRILPRGCSARQLWTEHQTLVKRWTLV